MVVISDLCHCSIVIRLWFSVVDIWISLVLSNPKFLQPLKHKISQRQLSSVVQLLKVIYDDAGVAEMAEQHDVKEILQLARKYVANVQDMVYGK